MPVHVVLCDAITRLEQLSDLDLIFSDPPWNTGKVQSLHDKSYEDSFSVQEFQAFADKLTERAYNALKPNATLAIWCDYRTGFAWFNSALRFGFKLGGEIIVESGLGKPSVKSWAMKHSNIYLFEKGSPYFNIDAIPTVPRLAAKHGYAGDKKATSVFWSGFSNTDPRRVGYPTEKNPTITEMVVKALCPPDGSYADVFCGSGSAAAFPVEGRNAYLSDISEDAIQVVTERMKPARWEAWLED